MTDPRDRGRVRLSLMQIGVELTAPVELVISITPRILLRLLVRAVNFPAFLSWSFTFEICPAGKFVTPAAKSLRRRALVVASS